LERRLMPSNHERQAAAALAPQHTRRHRLSTIPNADISGVGRLPVKRASKRRMSGYGSLEEYLRAAQPSLILRVDPEDGTRFKLTPYIREVERGCEEVLSEGFDPDHSPLGWGVYWRIVARDGERFYCSTFQATRDLITKAWGAAGLAHCDPLTDMAVACIETAL